MQNPVVTYPVPGQYDVTLQVSDGINVSSLTIPDMITVDDCTGIPDNNMTDFNIYPNPGKDVLNVRLHTDRGEAYTVVLRNLTGQVVHSKQHNGSGHDENIRINIENLPEGCYIIDLNTASKGSVYHKFIVVK